MTEVGLRKFATLAAPIAEIDKKDIISKTLDPTFKKKLNLIIERIVKPLMIPKSLNDSHGSTCYISGSDPLLELLCSTIEATTTEIAWDWQGTLQRFRVKATMEKLNGKVAFIAEQYCKGQGGHSVRFTFEARDSEGKELLQPLCKNAKEP